MLVVTIEETNGVSHQLNVWKDPANRLKRFHQSLGPYKQRVIPLEHKEAEGRAAGTKGTSWCLPRSKPFAWRRAIGKMIAVFKLRNFFAWNGSRLLIPPGS